MPLVLPMGSAGRRFQAVRVDGAFGAFMDLGGQCFRLNPLSQLLVSCRRHPDMRMIRMVKVYGGTAESSSRRFAKTRSSKNWTLNRAHAVLQRVHLHALAPVAVFRRFALSSSFSQRNMMMTNGT